MSGEVATVRVLGKDLDLPVDVVFSRKACGSEQRLQAVTVEPQTDCPVREQPITERWMHQLRGACTQNADNSYNIDVQFQTQRLTLLLQDRYCIGFAYHYFTDVARTRRESMSIRSTLNVVVIRRK